jgi:hypothetical protein
VHLASGTAAFPLPLTKQLKQVTISFMEDNDLLLKLSKSLFWDYDINALDAHIDRNLILERVFTRGTEDEEREVFNYYGKNVIKATVLKIKYFDKKTLNYLSIIFNVSKEQFRCYKRSLSENPFGIS